KRANLVTVLNPAPASREVLDGDLLSLVDVLTPNEGECAFLAAADGPIEKETDDASRIRAARRLQQLGCQQIVVTLGREGCLVVGRDAARIPGRAVRAVDATAAGDAINGALAVALSEGRPLYDAARWANAAAAISVTRRGAQPSLPGRREIADLFEG